MVQMQGLERQIEAEQGARSAPGKSRAEEEYFLARLVAEAEGKEIARLQKEVSCGKIHFSAPIQTACTVFISMRRHGAFNRASVPRRHKRKQRGSLRNARIGSWRLAQP